MIVKNFQDLIIWKDSINLTKEIFILTYKKYNKEYSLKDQIRRASISIPSNIAEGFERNSRLDFKRFLLIAKGSCGELITQLYLSKELHIINIHEFNTLNEKLYKLISQIGALIRHLRNKSNN